MGLKTWLDKDALRKQKPSKEEIAGLFALADRNLADAGVAGLSAEGSNFRPPVVPARLPDAMGYGHIK